jgi:hypothetical protein
VTRTSPMASTKRRPGLKAAACSGSPPTAEQSAAERRRRNWPERQSDPGHVCDRRTGTCGGVPRCKLDGLRTARPLGWSPASAVQSDRKGSWERLEGRRRRHDPDYARHHRNNARHVPTARAAMNRNCESRPRARRSHHLRSTEAAAHKVIVRVRLARYSIALSRNRFVISPRMR